MVAVFFVLIFDFYYCAGNETEGDFQTVSWTVAEDIVAL